MRVLYCGELWGGGTCRMRMEALARLGHQIAPVDTTYKLGLHYRLARCALHRVGRTVDVGGVNRLLLHTARMFRPEAIWIDKGLAVTPRTLQALRVSFLRESLHIIHYSPDDMGGRHNQSANYLRAIPYYDLHVTTKSYNVRELEALGARRVLFVNNGFCPVAHQPKFVSVEERQRLGGPVGFIGAFEPERLAAIRFLVENGVPVHVWGEGWPRFTRRLHPLLKVEARPIWGADYAKAISAFDINLGFLRRLNRDLQTTRSVEIPACGGFLLAERTVEHESLFAEGVEAEFFSSQEELLEKVRYYLANSARRAAIAKAGRERCLRSGYSYDRQVQTVLSALNLRAPREWVGTGPLP